MKNVLIWNDFPLQDAGGPSGYLYNLRNGLEGVDNNKLNIEFLGRFCVKKERSIDNIIKWATKKIISYNSYLEKKVRTKFNEKLISKLKENYSYEIDVSKFDAIHFHTTYSLFKARNILKSYEGKVILTTHTPQPTYEELISTLKYSDDSTLNEAKEIDKYALNRADYLIFPCKESLEPYHSRCSMWSDIIKEKISLGKVLFLPTGINSRVSTQNDKYFNQLLNIPEECLVVSYLGRHNEIKGYDLLVEAGKIILDRYDDVHFVIGGKLSDDIKPLSNSRWHELGWTKEGNNIVANSDLFILPNRETYFDLIFLEVLSLDTKLLCTNTGGNKYFKQYSSDDIHFCEPTINNIVDLFDEIYREIKESSVKDREKIVNREIFDEFFTAKKFVENYQDIMINIFMDR